MQGLSGVADKLLDSPRTLLYGVSYCVLSVSKVVPVNMQNGNWIYTVLFISRGNFLCGANCKLRHMFFNNSTWSDMLLPSFVTNWHVLPACFSLCFVSYIFTAL